MSYIHQALNTIGSWHPAVAAFEDYAVSIVFCFWAYELAEDRIKKIRAWSKKRAETKREQSTELMLTVLRAQGYQIKHVTDKLPKAKP